MNDWARLGNGFIWWVNVLVVLLIVFVPLGIWKLVDLVLWCWNHLSISVKW